MDMMPLILARRRLAMQPGVGGNDANTVLLLHCDGSDGSTTFANVAAGGASFNMTAVGDAQVDTAQKVFGSGSLLLDGTGDRLTTPDRSDWDFGSGDWTVDFRVRFASVAGVIGLVSQWHGTDNQRGWYILLNLSAGNLSFLGSTNGTSAGVQHNWSWIPSTDTWYHVAVVRDGNALHAYVDGTEIGSADDLTGVTLFNSSALLVIGDNAEGGQEASAHMGEIRITKGIARWTENFTPPAGPYSVA